MPSIRTGQVVAFYLLFLELTVVLILVLELILILMGVMK